MTHDEMMSVINAHKNGSKIEVRERDPRPDELEWEFTSNPVWNFSNFDYRIAPASLKGFVVLCRGPLGPAFKVFNSSEITEDELKKNPDVLGFKKITVAKGDGK